MHSEGNTQKQISQIHIREIYRWMYNYKSKIALNNLNWCCIGTKFGSSRSPLNAVEASFSTDDLAKSEGKYENENLQS